MKPDIQALINKAKDSLGAAKALVRDGYQDFAAKEGDPNSVALFIQNPFF